MSGEGIAEEHAQSRSRNRTDKGGQGEVAELYRSKGSNVVQEAKRDAGYHPEGSDGQPPAPLEMRVDCEHCGMGQVRADPGSEELADDKKGQSR